MFIALSASPHGRHLVPLHWAGIVARAAGGRDR